MTSLAVVMIPELESAEQEDRPMSTNSQYYNPSDDPYYEPSPDALADAAIIIHSKSLSTNCLVEGYGPYDIEAEP